jgi:peptide/nickel transport system substrate-binding protein
VRRTGRRGLPISACLLVLAFLATACQPGQWAVGQNDVNPVAVSTLVKGGTLNWPIIQLPSNYNGNAADGALGDESSIIGALMPDTFRFNASAQPVLDTDYLTSAEVTGSSPMVVTY